MLHRAGWALAKLHYKTSLSALQQVRAGKARRASGSPQRRQHERVLSVASVMRHEIDREKLANAFTSVARFQAGVAANGEIPARAGGDHGMRAREQPPGTPTWIVGEWLINHPGPDPFKEVDGRAFDWLKDEGLDIGV